MSIKHLSPRTKEEIEQINLQIFIEKQKRETELLDNFRELKNQLNEHKILYKNAYFRNSFFIIIELMYSKDIAITRIILAKIGIKFEEYGLILHNEMGCKSIYNITYV